MAGWGVRGIHFILLIKLRALDLTAVFSNARINQLPLLLVELGRVGCADYGFGILVVRGGFSGFFWEIGGMFVHEIKDDVALLTVILQVIQLKLPCLALSMPLLGTELLKRTESVQFSRLLAVAQIEYQLGVVIGLYHLLNKLYLLLLIRGRVIIHSCRLGPLGVVVCVEGGLGELAVYHGQHIIKVPAALAIDLYSVDLHESGGRGRHFFHDGFN